MRIKNIDRLKYVLFDFDGILVDTFSVHAISTINALKKVGINIKETRKVKELIKKNIGKPFDYILYLIEELLNLEIKDHNRIKYLKRKYYLQNLDKIKILPCVLSTLNYLKANGIKIGIASLASRLTIVKTLKSKSLERYFQSIVSIEDVLEKQDKSLLYLIGIRKLKCKPNEGYIIGDTPTDIKSARKIGAIPIGIATGEYSSKVLLAHGAYKVFCSLCDFLKYLRKRFI